MASRLATAPAVSSVDSCSNRRVYIRRPCGTHTTTRVAAGSRPRQARIQDISVGGVALISRQHLRVGTRLLIQMKNTDLGITYDLSARVIHATPSQAQTKPGGLSCDQRPSRSQVAANAPSKSSRPIRPANSGSTPTPLTTLASRIFTPIQPSP